VNSMPRARGTKIERRGVIASAALGAGQHGAPPARQR
jgi:hypothetical protein